MSQSKPFDRAALGRALTRLGNASVRDILADISSGKPAMAHRIGITGSPGAGKSTLIAKLAQQRLARASHVGVLAVDPSSPLSNGSILGDRIRMGSNVADARLFFRSMPSRRAHDGLVDNIADLLFAMEQHGLDEIIIETVGVGQVNYTIRSVADTVVLVMVPGAGDEVQAMKAGIMEIADIFVVNKSDLPGAKKVQSDLVQMLNLTTRAPDEWQPRVVMASAESGELGGLSEAIDDHSAFKAHRVDARARLRYHVESLIDRRVAEVLDRCDKASFNRGLAELYETVIEQL